MIMIEIFPKWQKMSQKCFEPQIEWIQRKNTPKHLLVKLVRSSSCFMEGCLSLLVTYMYVWMNREGKERGKELKRKKMSHGAPDFFPWPAMCCSFLGSRIWDVNWPCGKFLDHCWNLQRRPVKWCKLGKRRSWAVMQSQGRPHWTSQDTWPTGCRDVLNRAKIRSYMPSLASFGNGLSSRSGGAWARLLSSAKSGC